MDTVKEFTLDYRNILLNSFIATDGNFGDVLSFIVDCLVQAGYAPAVEYRKVRT